MARLSLSDDEKAKIKDEIGKIIDYMDILNQLDTAGVEPMSHVLPVTNVFRKDEVAPSYDREAILANAPDKADGAFRVPKTVE